MFDFLLPKVPQISTEEVKKAIDNNDKFILLDVRTKEEYLKGNLRGSINIPLDKVAKEILTKLRDKSAKIYVYCLSGSRSVFAVAEMVKQGYTNVFDMKQGLLAWRAKGYPVIS